jgi:pimeloyl-ACP methyl ester carboxylesterase
MTLRERRFETGRVEIGYVEGPPQGPPIVILHGGAASWQSGRSLIEQLLPHWHAYAPDLRGHGQSGRVPGRYHLWDYVADIAAFLEHVVGDPSIVFGHSLGGETAVAMAAEHPDLVRALIVGDAPLSTSGHVTDEPMHRAMNVLWHSLAGKPTPEIVSALKAMPVMVPGEEAPKRAADVFGERSPWFAFQATNLHQLDPGVLEAVLEGPEHMLAGYDPDRLLPAIHCPVLLVQADPQAGGLLRDEEVQMALRLLANGTHVHLPGIGHELHGPPEQASRVLDAIAPFLEGVIASSSP